MNSSETEEMVGPGYTRAQYDREIDPVNFPIIVMLRFENRESRDSFMGGLSDGFGENVCDLHWPWLTGKAFDEQNEFNVTVFNESEEEDC